MIDEKKLIESIRASLNTGKECFPVDLIIECIEEQQQVGEWILCNDILPIEKKYEVYDNENDIVWHKHVLAYTDNPDIKKCVAYYDTDSWFCAVTNTPINVIKWMDLPGEDGY